MSMTLLHEFNPLGGRLPALDDITSLHDLAARLWELEPAGCAVTEVR
jgi:hypothetical protein